MAILNVRKINSEDDYKSFHQHIERQRLTVTYLTPPVSYPAVLIYSIAEGGNYRDHVDITYVYPYDFNQSDLSPFISEGNR